MNQDPTDDGNGVLTREADETAAEASALPELTVPKAAEEVEGDEEDDEEEERTRKRHLEEELERFKEEMARKRVQRRQAVGALRSELQKERAERLRLEALMEDGGGKALVEGLERQVAALKDVALIGGEMIRIRELQVSELKSKLEAIEETGIAYEKEVENMRKLRVLYEERTRATAISHQMEVEREKARVVAAETRLEIAEEKKRELLEANKELQERIASLDSAIDRNNTEISELRVQLAGKNEELHNATSQITIVNNLFSQLLTEPESLDRVTRVLEEHHDLMNHLTSQGNINDVASVLMRVADKDRVLTGEEQGIATNLSKVWKLLVELIGLHTKQPPGEAMPESCYKSIDTPTGPKVVISVSQTFLRLKDLILEKNSLVKEVSRLKDLNTHLEQRLSSQEQRLVEVAEELHKTWGVVNKLKSQHKAIHTHEQILRYELKHKRMMLNELKQQLEECREMWQMARAKNSQTENDWKILRKEFAERKQQVSSAESGYEESPGESQDEQEDGKISDDESEIQEVPSRSPRCLRISRLLDSETSTPDRSNTPDIILSEADDTEVSEAISQNEDLPLEEEMNILPGSVNEVENQNPREEQNCSTEVYVDEYTVDMEQSVQILPWNDAPDEKTVESIMLPSIPEISKSQEKLESLDSVDSRISKVILPGVSSGNNEQDATKAAMFPEDVHVRAEVILHSVEESNSTESSIAKTEDVVEPSTSQRQNQEETAESPKLGIRGLEDTASTCSTAGPSTQETSEPCTSQKPSAEEILARREARLKRLEEQCQNLFQKMSNTNKRSDKISNKLVELHEQYGDSKKESNENQNKEEAVGSSHQNTSDQTSDSPTQPRNEETTDVDQQEN